MKQTNVVSFLLLLASFYSLVTANCRITVTFPTITPASVCSSASGSASFYVTTSGTSQLNIKVKVDNFPASYASAGFTYTVTGITAGFRRVTFYDRSDEDCEETINIQVPKDTVPVTAVIMSTVNVTCVGKSDGSVLLRGSGGSGSGYQVKYGSGAWGTTWGYNDLAPGTYSYKVRDSRQCESLSVSARIFDRPAVVAEVQTTHERCFGTSIGSASVFVSGGTGTGYKIEFNGNTIESSQSTFQPLSPGPYSITVKDSNQCSSTKSFEIQPATVINIGDNTVAVQCSGTSTGSVKLSATGGNSTSYLFKLGNSEWTTKTHYEGLGAGNYSYSVQDANLCQKHGVAEVKDRPALKVTVSSQNITCAGLANGRASFSITGGSGGYKVSFDGRSFVPLTEYPNLASRSYTYIVQDSNNCEISGTVIIHSKSPVRAIVTMYTNETCAGTNSGTVLIGADGGVGGYTISFDKGQYNDKWSYDKLAPGKHNATVKDANSCVSSEVYVTISAYPAITASATSTRQERCEGNPTGTITIVASGGNGVFTYSINNGRFSTSSTFEELNSGNYRYVVQDGNECKFSGDKIVDGPIVSISNNINNHLNLPSTEHN